MIGMIAPELHSAGTRGAQGLAEAARAFEALVVAKMWEAGQSAAGADAPLAGGREGQFYRQLFLNEVASRAARGGRFGLAEQLLRRFPDAKEVGR